MQAVGVASVSDRQQRPLRDRKTATSLGIQTVVLLRRGHGNHGIVPVVAAQQEDAHQRLIPRAGGGERVHLAEFCHAAQRA